MKESMIEKTLTSGRKLYIRKLSRPDIRFCRDLMKNRVYPDKSILVIDAAKSNDAWLQRGIGGLDDWKAKNGELAPDEILCSLTEVEEIEVLELVKGSQHINPSKPSSSD
tara:strand:- start:1995 stop:2324 length:330 start_codon:yes stop_codon:yes gene_type:complete